jgi:hypothetical protein
MNQLGITVSKNDIQQFLRFEHSIVSQILFKNSEQEYLLGVEGAVLHPTYLSQMERKADRFEQDYLSVIKSRKWRYALKISNAFNAIPFSQFLETVIRRLLRFSRKLVGQLYHFPKRVYNRIRRHSEYLICKYGLFKVKYEAWYEEDIDFSEYKTDVKAIAFYLPQYHQIPQNDEWWGKGFTEWTNTQKAEPLFRGHYQPREPHADIGYYDLTDIEVLKRQTESARRHGIHGFCFYHYWFSGDRLLEKPVDMYLEQPEIDFPFCLCWANENWTRRWDGGDTTVLMEQLYNEDDDQKFIQDLEKYLRDKRYITIEGKPLIVIYHVANIPDSKYSINVWREYCRKTGIGEIAVYAAFHSALNKDMKAEDIGVDGFVEFPPHHTACHPLNYDKTTVYDYVSQARNYGRYDGRPDKCFKGVMVGWDNTARKGKNKALLFTNFHVIEYFEWLRRAISFTRRNFKESSRFLFINAWNEWAEGTYLEPDEKFGYIYLNITSRALFDLPHDHSSEDDQDECLGRQTILPYDSRN